MDTRELLLSAFDNVEQALRGAVEGIDADLLTARLDPQANTVAWLAWHLTRVQDDHIAEVAGREQTWTAAGWSDRFGLPFDAGATGYGFTSDDVAAVRVSDPALLTGYQAEVHQRTAEFLRGLTDADLDRVVDEKWDPPVTLGVRLVSVVTDDLQHAGQAALLRGLLERRAAPTRR